jgi:hypothetical protein
MCDNIWALFISPKRKVMQYAMRRIIFQVVVGLLPLLIGGCATGYSCLLRAEYAISGHGIGLYEGVDEYPSLYPGTKMVCMVEIPTWVYVSDVSQLGWHSIIILPCGVALTTVDLLITASMETLLFPYDMYNVASKPRAKGMDMESTKKVLIEELENDGVENNPTLPNVGSENVPIKQNEEKLYE